MERVAFLLERTGERLGCLLNPESLVVRRVAGVRPRRSVSGALTGAALADDPLLHTGGGTTEMQLDLLFDVSVAGSTIPTEDVRDLTAPLWRLTENTPGDDGYGLLPQVLFVWGKSWSVPGIITAVAERLEYFTPGGCPRRSYLRMKLRRVSESLSPPPAVAPQDGLPPSSPQSGPPMETDIPPEQVQAHVLAAGERLDGIAQQFYNAPDWRPLAIFNGIDDPLRIPPGFVLRIPPLDFSFGGTEESL